MKGDSWEQEFDDLVVQLCDMLDKREKQGEREMSVFQHCYFIVTTSLRKDADEAVALFHVLGGTEVIQHTSTLNGVISIIIPPCGSKEGWEPHEAHQKTLKQFSDWLDESGDGKFTWTWVSHGDLGARIEATNSENMLGEEKDQ